MYISRLSEIKVNKYSRYSILLGKLAAHGLDRCTVCWGKTDWISKLREQWGLELSSAGDCTSGAPR